MLRSLSLCLGLENYSIVLKKNIFFLEHRFFSVILLHMIYEGYAMDSEKLVSLSLPQFLNCKPEGKLAYLTGVW